MQILIFEEVERVTQDYSTNVSPKRVVVKKQMTTMKFNDRGYGRSGDLGAL